MLLDNQPHQTERYTFNGLLTNKDIEALLNNKRLKVVQVAGLMSPGAWQLLDQAILAKRPEIQFRLVSSHGGSCDLSCLQYMRNIRDFSVYSLGSAHSLETLSALSELESLSIGIRNLKDLSFLDSLPKATIKKISLERTNTKSLDISCLSAFQNLRTLYLEGHRKNIEVVGSLKKLSDLTLRSITLPSAQLMTQLPELRFLAIKLGGTKVLDELAHCSKIAYLELWQIRAFHDLSFLSQMVGIEYIFLQSLINVRRIPRLDGLTKLRRVYLENMKGIRDVTPLITAPNLEEFIHVDSKGMNPEDYAEFILKAPKLKKASIGTGSEKKNQMICDMLFASGRQKYISEPFQYSQ